MAQVQPGPPSVSGLHRLALRGQGQTCSHPTMMNGGRKILTAEPSRGHLPLSTNKQPFAPAGPSASSQALRAPTLGGGVTGLLTSPASLPVILPPWLALSHPLGPSTQHPVSHLEDCKIVLSCFWVPVQTEGHWFHCVLESPERQPLPRWPAAHCKVCLHCEGSSFLAGLRSLQGWDCHSYTCPLTHLLVTTGSTGHPVLATSSLGKGCSQNGPLQTA